MRRAVVLVGLVTVGVGTLLDRRGLGAWSPDRDLDALTACAAALLVVGALLSLAAARPVRSAGGVLAGVASVPAGIATVEAVGTGLPGPSTGVLAVGLVVTFAGTLARVVGPDGGRSSRPRIVAAAGTATVITAVAAAAAALLVVDLPVRASTAVPVAVAAEVTPAGVRWVWSEGETVRDVRAAGAGVVVGVDDGVVALDGTTGAERWRHRRAGARLDGLAVSADRATVVTLHAARDTGATLLTVLDAMTGARRFETSVNPYTSPLLTDTTLVVDERLPDDGDEARFRLRARSLTDGTPRWTWDPPPGCDLTVLRSTTTRTVVPVELDCPEGSTVLGLVDGREAWRFDTGARGEYPVSSTADGSLLVAGAPGGHAVLDPTTGAVLGTLTDGFPLPGPDGRPTLVGGTPERVVAAFDPATGTTAPVAPGCAAERTATVTDRAVVRLCRTPTGTDVQIDDGPVLPVGLGRPDGSAALGSLREEFVVPGPGAVAVGVAGPLGSVVGIGAVGVG